MKKLIVCFYLLSTVTFLCGQEVVEAIVAVINDEVITLYQYKRQSEILYQTLSRQLQGAELNEQYKKMRKELLDQMITDVLLLQEAKKLDINVNEQVNMSIEKIKKDNGIETDNQLKQVLMQQGISFEDWKMQMEENLMKQNIIFTNVGRTVVIDDSEIVSYYKQHQDEFTEPPVYSLKAISISAEGKSEEEVQAKMEKVEAKIKAGEDFAVISGEYSEGPEKESQGDLGVYKKGELEKNLEQAVDVLKKGEITPWLEIKSGWYLLRLEDRKESYIKAFDDVKKEIEKKLFEERSDKKLKKYLEEVKQKSYIKILLPNPLDF
ncbi:MAG: peptidyl-prolyl cis-trans isomerase [Acidobacteriota bacterium]|nr:peptidyl-prolyl cis-trans isomerase [Acidobacteriota bacterium]